MDKQTAQHYQWGDNCESWVLVDTEGLSVKQETMPGGMKENLHFHVNAQQFFFILKGTATFTWKVFSKWWWSKRAYTFHPGPNITLPMKPGSRLIFW